MPSREIFVRTDGIQLSRLNIEWKGKYKNVSFAVDGKSIGYANNHKELKTGKEFVMPDGSTLFVTVDKKNILRLARDGKPLDGYDPDAISAFENGYQIIFFIAAISGIGGLIAVIGNIEFLLALGMGFPSIVFGGIMFVLGMFARDGSTKAFWAALAIYVLDTVVGLYLAASEGYSPGVGGIVVRLVFTWYMYKGIEASRKLN